MSKNLRSFQGVGIGQAALEEARKYAAERVQFGTAIEKLQPIKRILNEMDATVQAMRAITYKCSEFVDILEGTSAKLEKEGLNEKEIRKHNILKTFFFASISVAKIRFCQLFFIFQNNLFLFCYFVCDSSVKIFCVPSYFVHIV